jgi:N-acetyl sugar amidotransferase
MVFKIKYCARCVLPVTKPDLSFNEQGVCDACQNYEFRTHINWQEREKLLVEILNESRMKSQSGWDCVIPVSGGKDSTYQVKKMLAYGMTPLCVTATTCDLSTIGRENIENIKALGVDHISFSPNPVVRRQLNRIGLTEVGDISWPEHVSIFTIPITVAVKYKIPLIIWGENPQNEYGGPQAAKHQHILDRRWLEEFGGLLGLRTSDLAHYGLLEKDLYAYTYPSDEELTTVGVKGIFLGSFIPWHGHRNALMAQGYGFKTYHHCVEGSMVNYENLDNHQTGIHDYFKFLKFGFSRASDIASMLIRRGILSRSEALELVKLHDGKFPWQYLGKSLEAILQPLAIDVKKFIEICDQFTNKQLFLKNADGSLKKDKDGNLTKINYDNDEIHYELANC